MPRHVAEAGNVQQQNLLICMSIYMGNPLKPFEDKTNQGPLLVRQQLLPLLEPREIQLVASHHSLEEAGWYLKQSWHILAMMTPSFFAILWDLLYDLWLSTDDQLTWGFGMPPYLFLQHLATIPRSLAEAGNSNRTSSNLHVKQHWNHSIHSKSKSIKVHCRYGNRCSRCWSHWGCNWWHRTVPWKKRGGYFGNDDQVASVLGMPWHLLQHLSSFLNTQEFCRSYRAGSFSSRGGFG